MNTKSNQELNVDSGSFHSNHIGRYMFIKLKYTTTGASTNSKRWLVGKYNFDENQVVNFDLDFGPPIRVCQE